MLIIFNSGFRDNYIGNVLNTLCFPYGASNWYSYGVIEPGKPGGNVTMDDATRARALPVNSPVMVVFIDRFRGGEPYVYHPLRRGVLVGADIADGRLHVRVRLHEYCAARDVDKFSQAVATELVPVGAPQLTGTSENPQDGHYVVVTDGDFGAHLIAQQSDDAWRTIVDRLAATKALTSSAEQPVVFARAVVVDDTSRDTPVVPGSLNRDQDRFQIARGRKYALVVSYVSPVQAIDKSVVAELDVTLGDDLRATSDPKRGLNAVARREDVTFATKQYMEDNKSRLTLSFVPPVGVKKFFAPKIDIPLEIIERPRAWGMLALLAMLYCAGTALVGLDFSKAITKSVIAAKIGGSLAQVAAVILMSRFFGKKYA